MKRAGRWGRLLWEVGIFIVAVGVVFLTVLFFFNGLLSGSLVGNDMRLAYSYASFYDYYFPKIPVWYPLVGGGTSLTLGYPILASLVVVAIRRLTELTLVQAMVAFSFFSFVLSGVFLYLFGAYRLKNKTVGLVAAVSFFLSHIMWGWYVTAGFFAFSASFFFVPLAFFCFDYWFEKLEKGEGLTNRGRLGFLASVLSFSLSFLLHPSTGIIIFSGLFFYLIGKLIVSKVSLRQKAKIFFGGFVLPIVVSLALISFWLLPFYHFSGLANRDGFLTVSPSGIAYYEFDQMFGLRPWDMWNMSGMVAFNRGVSLLAIGGVLLGLFGAFRKVFPLLFVTLLPLLYITSILGNSILPLKSFLDVRGNVLLTFFIPVLSGFGVYFAARILFYPLVFLVTRIKIPVIRPILLGLVALLTSGAAFLIGWRVIARFPNLPSNSADRVEYVEGIKYVNYIDYLGWGPVNPGQKLLLSEKPEVWWQAVKDFGFRNEYASGVDLSLLPKDFSASGLEEAPRVFLSPSLGQIIQDLPTVSFASNIEAYTYQLSLIHWSWGYSQARIFFGLGVEGELDEWAKWYGLAYAGLNTGRDDPSVFQKAGWRELPGPVKLFAAPFDLSLVSISQKPRVLVIGKYKVRPYEQIFKQAVQGLLSYDEAILFEGEDRVDSYSREELAKYDLLILHGYEYGDRKKAESLLSDYVSAGGKIFINAGWQFKSPDWQAEETPVFFPFENLIWEKSLAGGAFQIEDGAIRADVTKLGPLIYADSPWGVTSGELRSSARTILSYAGKPLIASMKYGQGEVVVSGLNVFAHISVYENNPEEIKLVNQVMLSLLSDKKNSREDQLTYSRDFPDKLTIGLERDYRRETVYFREAYFPDWQARLVDADGKSKRLKIERAGVGFMSFFVDEAKKGDQIVLEIKEGFAGYLGKLASLTTALLLFLGLIFSRTILGYWGRIEKKVKQYVERNWSSD